MYAETEVFSPDSEVRSLEERFEEIAEFLQGTEEYWRDEVLERYPDELEDFPPEWIDALSELSLEDLYQLERKGELSVLRSKSASDYFARASDLRRMPISNAVEESSIPPDAFCRVRGKKEHEIRVLAERILRLHRSGRISTAFDFAGGIGYLSQVLAHHCNIPTLCIDANTELQELGILRDTERRPKTAQSVRYLHCDIMNDELPSVDDDTLNLGLHTCGSLSSRLLRSYAENTSGVLLNFGCCYYRTESDDLHMSNLSKRFPLPLKGSALTLASRSHRDSIEAFYLSKRVKLFRYMIHLFLYHELNVRSFVGLGNSPRNLYRESFSTYALEQLRRLKIENVQTKDLETFFSNPEHQARVRKMISANILRASAGRLIELYIVLDRAIYLKEHGLRVDVAEYFNERISPRNLGIFADSKPLR